MGRDKGAETGKQEGGIIGITFKNSRKVEFRMSIGFFSIHSLSSTTNNICYSTRVKPDSFT